MTTQHQIDALRDAPVAEGRNLIDGAWQPAASGALMEVISPLDGARLTGIAQSGTADAEAAVTAARRAFEDGRWRNQSPQARRKVLLTWADLIEAALLELTVLGVRDNGTEIAMALKAEAASAAATIRYYAEAIDKTFGQIAPTKPDVLGLVHREPIGVVAAIVPWNFPLMIAAWKLAPALAAGNSVVLKPSEMASLALLRVVEMAHEAGLPDGVLNVVTGAGPEAGAALSHSMDVDVVAFTGSGAVGRKLLEGAAASNLKRCYLELGGKSPNILFDDAPDLDHAITVAANGVFRNSGQVCVAAARLLVQRSIYDRVAEGMAQAAAHMVVGDPLSLATQAGAVNNEAQLARNLAAVEKATSEGATLRHGGQRILDETGGTYMAPTVLSDVAPAHHIFREEAFGPILSLTPFDDEEDAIRLANASDYGLAAGVWTGNLSRAHRMVRAIRAGVVHVNTYGGVDVTVPLGGVKQSGNGYDKSLFALDKFYDLKTAWMQL
ncbi:MAG: aldehyde dehydrogenase family protein [Pseudomonadota bacterium]